MPTTDDPFQFFTNCQQNLNQATCDFLILTSDQQLRAPRINDGVQDQIQRIFLAPLIEHFTADPEAVPRIRDYDPAVLQHEEFVWKLSVRDVPKLNEIQDQLGLPVDEMLAFGDSDESIGEIKGFVARIETSVGQLIVFQKLAQNTVLKSSLAYKLLYSGQSFSKVDADAVLQISPSNNCAFILGDAVYILQAGPFEWIFDYHQKKAELAKQKSHQIHRQIDRLLALPDGKSLWDYIGHQKRLVNKLQKLDVTSMPNPEQLKQINIQYGLELAEVDGKLAIDNPHQAKKLINAINEDYVSSITGKKFETHSKERLS